MMKEKYQSNLSHVTLKRIRGDTDVPRIDNLDLTNGFISPFCMHMIAKAIVQNNEANNINGSLYDINLARNQICGVDDRGEGEYDPSGLIELIETLIPSRCLRTLNLERNYIGTESCVALAKLLESRNPLSHLNLKCCSLTSEDIIKLVAKMKKNTHLQILNLSSNFVKASGIESLRKIVAEKRCVLHYIDLSNNRLGENEAEVLVTVMKDNISISTLILDDNELGDEGTNHIGKMLLKAKNLEQLSLHNNAIGHVGTRELALALEQNTKLKYLGLQWNELTNLAVEFLAKGLLKNKGLKVLALVGNDFDDSRAALLVEASIISNSIAVQLDVPTAPIRANAIAIKELETIGYYPFQS